MQTNTESSEVKRRNRSSDDDIAKYEKAWVIYLERKGALTLKSLAETHQINYQNFLNHLKRKGLYTGKPRKTEQASYEFKLKQQEEQLQLYNHSVIAIKYGDLELLLKESLDKGIAQSARKFVKEKRAVIINLL